MSEIEMEVIAVPGSHNQPPAEVPEGNWKERKDSCSSWDHLVTVVGFGMGFHTMAFFPSVCETAGGGAFIIAYLVVLLAVGLPLLLLESFVGQFTSSNCISVYSHYPAFKGVGILSCLMIIIILPYAFMLLSHTLLYLAYSFDGSSQWKACNNSSWDTKKCADDVNALRASFGEGFYRNRISVDTEYTGLLWTHCLASLVVCAVVFVCVFNGVKFLAKVMWILTSISLLLILVLFIHGNQLPGATDGIEIFLDAKFYTLLDPLVWVEATKLCITSLAFGYGVHTTLGSFTPFRNSVVLTSLVVTGANAAFSLIATLYVYSVWGFMLHKMEALTYKFEGVDLLFQMFPAAFSMMPDSTAWSAVFYVFLFVLSIKFPIVLMQVLVVCVEKSFPQWAAARWQVALALCSFVFLLSLPFCSSSGMKAAQQIMIYLIGHTSYVICLLEIIVFVYIYGAGRIARDLEMLTNVFVSYYCYFTWPLTTPLMLLLLELHIVMTMGRLFLGILICMSSVFFIAGYGIYYILRTHLCTKSKNQHPKSWGPALEADKAKWREFCERWPLRNIYAHRVF